VLTLVTGLRYRRSLYHILPTNLYSASPRRTNYSEVLSAFIHSGYFYSASSSPLLLLGTHNYSIDTVSESTCRSATDNCEWRTYPRSLRFG